MRLMKRERSPYWWAEFTVNGVRHRISTKRPIADQAGAKRFMANEYERLMNQKQFGVKPEITLREAMEKTVKSVTGQTKRSYELNQARWLGEGSFDRDDHWSLDGNMLLSSLKQEHLDEHVQERREEGKAVNTIIIEIRFIQRVCNLMGKRYAVDRDLEFTKPSPFKKTRWLSDDEEKAILDFLDAHKGSPAYDKAKDLMIFLIDTGVRLSEALNMAWSDINMTLMEMEAYRGKTSNLSMVPMSDRVHEMLTRLHNQPQPFMEMSRAVRILRKTIRDICNTNPRIVKQRGSATVHSLRDTFASRMVSRGMSLHKVSKLLGHTSPAMTAKYAQLETRDVLSEARLILNK